MKNVQKSAGIVLAFLILSFSADAQFINKIKNAASRGVENAVEKKVEEQANKMAQQQLEKQFASIFGEDGENRPAGVDMDKMLKGMGEDVTVADQYEFFGYMNMEMLVTDKNGKKETPSILKSYLSKDTNYTGMEFFDPKNPEAVTAMIFDVPNQALIMLMERDNQKSSFAYKADESTIGDATDEAIAAQVEDPEFVIEKTGNTKEILGYECDEYHVKSKDGEGLYWMTEEPIGGYASFWGTNSPFMSAKAQRDYASHFSNLPKGNFMEMTYTTSEGDKIDMKVTEINESAATTFEMASYPNMLAGAKAD